MKLRLWLRMVGHALRAPLTGPHGLRRTLVLLLFTPAFVLLQTLHWVALALDELLYPDYRRVRIDGPLFVLGFPRSGTTFLHETLALDDERFVSATLWECLFAPAIVERRLLRVMGRLDGAVGRPVGRLLSRMERRVAGELADINPIGLRAPAEDQLLLLPAFACFLLVAVHPLDPAVWALVRFDEWPPDRRREFVTAYGRLVQRHLYAHGAEDRRYLSKNPSFTPLAGTLLETFPDSRVVFCYRDPAEAVPSQLSSLRPVGDLFGWDPGRPEVRERFLDLYARFGEQGRRVLASAGSRGHVLALTELGADPAAAIADLYRRFGWTPSERFIRRLAEHSSRWRGRSGSHEYTAEEFGLSSNDLASPFDPARRHFDPTASGVES